MIILVKIKQMSEKLANMIAAGEVVERPKSIIKELVENALDAKATAIKITLKKSGITYLSVEDNGVGMSKEDALLAFQKHATSKIFAEDDLFNIHTLGFRGEALAAIASVTDVVMKTGEKNQLGTSVYFSHGKLMEHETIDQFQGTKIEVTRLFENTPARLKHLKSMSTEYAHILDYLQKMALIFTDIRFTFIHDNKNIFKTFGTGDLLSTLSMIYGDKLSHDFLPFAVSDYDFNVTGYISKPQIQRTNNKVLHLSVNRRSIRHFGVNRAIIAGYGTLIPKGNYPIVVLNIEVDPKLVDVNVHPAKLEVRLSKEQQLEKLIEQGIKEVLQQENLIPKIVERPQQIKSTEQSDLFSTTKNSIYTHETKRKLKKEEQEVMKQFIENLRSEDKREDLKIGPTDIYDTTTVRYSTIEEPIIQTDVYQAEQQNMDKSTKENMQKNADTGDSGGVKQEGLRAQKIIENLRVIGQFDATYIVAENEGILYMIDQHAAQEKIKYEEYMKKQEHHRQIITQELLIPFALQVNPYEMEQSQNFYEALKKTGILFEVFGEHTLRITAIPKWLPENKIELYFRQALDVVNQHGNIKANVVLEKELIMLSCKYSIKANAKLTIAEMENLLLQLSKLKEPFTCPHGRPIIIEVSKSQIERWFFRA